MLSSQTALTLLSLPIVMAFMAAEQQQQPTSGVQSQRYSGRRHSPGWNLDSRKESKGEQPVPRGAYGKGFPGGLGIHGLHSPPPSINHTLTPTNVTGQLGATAYLHCYVHNAGQKTVTWIRRADYHILTVGIITYTTDERFSAVRGEPHALASIGIVRDSAGVMNQTRRHLLLPPSLTAGEDWMLQIRNVQKGDAGEYECQVNTQYPIISSRITLHVLSPHAAILEGSEVFVNSGSVVSLTCVIHDCPIPPTHIFWYHGDRVVNYDSRDARNRIEITDLQQRGTQKGASSSGNGPRRVSRLVIQSVRKEHSGSYTCAPVDSAPATVQVLVLQEEEQLARQSSSEASGGPSTEPLLTFYALGPLLVLQIAFLLVVARTT